jgi:hypothetical protein
MNVHDMLTQDAHTSASAKSDIAPMHTDASTRNRLRTVALVAVGFAGLYLAISRPFQFREQVRRGQPIVRAIEEFKRQTGEYPVTLADLLPKYLPEAPETSDRPNRKFQGWDYQTVTSGVTVTYSLRYYMGKGGVEYEPPVWFGNDEGRRSVLLRND